MGAGVSILIYLTPNQGLQDLRLILVVLVICLGELGFNL